jgi:hypothetical protein
MSVIESFGVLVNILQLHVSAGVEGDVVEDHHDFLQEIIDFDWRFDGSSDQNFNWAIVV